jgi:hypothetical protein
VVRLLDAVEGRRIALCPNLDRAAEIGERLALFLADGDRALRDCRLRGPESLLRGGEIRFGLRDLGGQVGTPNTADSRALADPDAAGARLGALLRLQGVEVLLRVLDSLLGRGLVPLRRLELLEAYVLLRLQPLLQRIDQLGVALDEPVDRVRPLLVGDLALLGFLRVLLQLLDELADRSAAIAHLGDELAEHAHAEQHGNAPWSAHEAAELGEDAVSTGSAEEGCGFRETAHFERKDAKGGGAGGVGVDARRDDVLKLHLRDARIADGLAEALMRLDGRSDRAVHVARRLADHTREVLHLALSNGDVGVDLEEELCNLPIGHAHSSLGQLISRQLS